MEIEEVKKEVSKIIIESLRDMKYSAFFFGSRVTGTASLRSDLDIGIEGEDGVPNNIMQLIKSRCEAIPTLYSIDIVDFSLLSEEFKTVAKTKIEIIR